VSPPNPFMTRAAHRGKQGNAFWRAPKQEKDLAKRLNARQVSRSGAGTTKGDLRISGLIRVEAKSTSRLSFAVTRGMLDKIRNAALPCGEFPILVVEFLDAAGKPEAELAICDVKHLESLIHAAQDTSKTRRT
jgi:hypothetical protein